MSFLLEKIKAGIKNERTINYPGTSEKIKVRLLTNQDMQDACFAADALYKAQKVDIGFHNVNDYEVEKDTQRIYRACSDMDGNPLAPTITEFRSLTTVQERSLLIEDFNQLDQECNISPNELPAGEFDALVETLKKKPDQTIGNISNIATLRRLTLFFVKLLPS